MPNTNKKPIMTDNDVLSSLNANGVYLKNQIAKFTKFSRFGYFDPYETNYITREYVFFTKMDLHLFTPGTSELNEELRNKPFFTECYNYHRDTMHQLQSSVKNLTGNSPFCNLLTNTVSSKLEIPDISIETIETANNINGVKMEYPLITATSSNLQDFNLEFEDTKHLDVYMFFRIWYEYEILKSKGEVTPPPIGGDRYYYIKNKILHDQMSCYKIVVGEDGETIVYWAKYWGVFPTSVPRSSFNDLADRQGPITIPVSFQSQWVEDMDPNILSDFNKLTENKINSNSKDIPIYNTNTGMINGVWCTTPHIVRDTVDGRKVYKLKWR